MAPLPVAPALPPTAPPPGAAVPVRVHPLLDRLRTADRVVLAFAAALGVLAALAPGQAGASLVFVARAFAGVAPWFAASVLLVAAAQASGADTLVGRAFAGREGLAVIAAAMLGALAPFCSCGVIPVVAGFLAAGVPVGPVMAFWLASPLMDPAKFGLLAGTLGIGFALAQTLAAVGIGLLGGFGTAALARAGVFDAALRDAGAPRPSSCRARANRPGPPAAQVVWHFWEEPERAQRFVVEAWRTGWFLARWLAVAFLAESLMSAWLPGEAVARHLGAGDAAAAIPLAVLLGVPAYLNGYAAVPLVKGLVDLGMSPAVGLVCAGASPASPGPRRVSPEPRGPQPQRIADHTDRG